MTTATLTLTDFLLARIAEDEAFINRGWLEDSPFDRSRVLAECEAKRRIIAREGEGLKRAFDSDDWVAGWVEDGVLKHLASVYADHPDFRKEWQS